MSKDSTDSRRKALVDRIYMVLLSALEQTHCTLVACDSERVIVALSRRFECPPKSNDVLTMPLGCYMAGAT